MLLFCFPWRLVFSHLTTGTAEARRPYERDGRANRAELYGAEDIESRELFLWSERPQSYARRLHIRHRRPEGQKPKIVVKDENGFNWKAKLGTETRSLIARAAFIGTRELNGLRTLMEF